ncbi:hypothetical protein [Nocardioides sp. SR21]|uniref:hypothetical protein n=1 Tax=Nocardioides sp. SR21 TaxID=2919501 RepID=UPI001FAAC750|nr:hypothetical protein [Nocardioides sp. SR21]
MKLSSPRLLAGATVASLLLVGVVTATSVPGPALAAGDDRPSTITVADPAHDVREIDVRDEEAGNGTAAPTRSNGDVRSMTVTYGPSEIEIVTEFRELRRPTQRAPRLVAGGTLFTSENVIGSISMYASRRDPHGTSMLDGVAECVSHRVDYRLNRVVVRVPADCLGDPTWVRVQAFGAVFRTTQEGHFVQGDVAPGLGLRHGRLTSRVFRP